MNLNSQTLENENPSRRGLSASTSVRCTVSTSLRFRSSRGLTLVEFMVAAGVGSLIVAAIAIVFTTSARNFAGMGNYISMNNSSRNTLDRLTREIRRAGRLTGFTNTPTDVRLHFVNGGTTNVVFQWDANSRQLTQWTTGSATTNVLLTECDELALTLYKSSLSPTANVAEVKAISVSWNCSRTMFGIKTTTEFIQQALIVIRNPPSP